MSCGTCGMESNEGAAQAVGAPAATGALPHHCACGWFLPRDGKCRNPDHATMAQTAATTKASPKAASHQEAESLIALMPAMSGFPPEDLRSIAARDAARELASSWADALHDGAPIDELARDVDYVVAMLEAWKENVRSNFEQSADFPGRE